MQDQLSFIRISRWWNCFRFLRWSYPGNFVKLPGLMELLRLLLCCCVSAWNHSGVATSECTAGWQWCNVDWSWNHGIVGFSSLSVFMMILNMLLVDDDDGGWWLMMMVSIAIYIYSNYVLHLQIPHTCRLRNVPAGGSAWILRDTTTLNVTGVTSVFRVLRLFRLWRPWRGALLDVVNGKKCNSNSYQ